MKPRAETVITEAIFQRPIMSMKSREAIDLLNNVQGQGGIWFCGSYANYAIPLQENCVKSALYVSSRLAGSSPNWIQSKMTERNCTNPSHPDVSSTSGATWKAAALISASFAATCLALGTNHFR